MSAILSHCGTYRYRLGRWADEIDNLGPVFAFFGVNPSTADADVDDATVRRWRGFTRSHGGSRFIVGNVFAYRATDVRELATAADPVGPHNAKHVADITVEADVLVPCWGARAKVPRALRHHLDLMMAALNASGKPVMVFGRAKCGSPLHPLMLPASTRLVPWEMTPLDCGGGLPRAALPGG